MLTIAKNLTVSLALALNQFVDPWALNVIGWKYVSPGLLSNKHGLIAHSISCIVDGCVSSWFLLSYS
jgi:hypothetical protein